jgi:hypothetical protein
MKNRFSVGAMIKSAGSFTSAMSLSGLRHLSGASSMADLCPGLFSLESLAPRRAILQILRLLEHTCEISKSAASGDCALSAQELQNKLAAFRLFEFVDCALNLRSDVPVSLPRLVAGASALGSYHSLWATEGCGHLFTAKSLQRGRRPHGLMATGETADIPRTSLTPLHAGMGLAFAESVFETADHQSCADGGALAEFLELCHDNCSPGYDDVAFEALGLAAHTLHPHLISTIDATLSTCRPHLLGYFWHGIGRAAYFSPTEFLVFWGQSRENFRKCVHEAPHDVARQNVIAGFAWALALVNIRHPAIVAAFLDLEGGNMDIQDGIVNGFCSALLVWRDSQTEDEQSLRDFVEYQPGAIAGRASQLWKTYVREPWSHISQKQVKPRGMGKIFQYQPLSEIMALIESRPPLTGRPDAIHQAAAGRAGKAEGMAGMENFLELFMVRPVSSLISSLQMLTEDLPLTVKMDAMISRATQILSRPADAQFQIVDRNKMNVAGGQCAGPGGKESTATAGTFLRAARNEI